MGTLTHGSLFSGIGGFDLAAEWMGWENKFHCEWNEFGQKVLKYYWPNSELFTDITKSDFKKYANQIDILTGGYPCHPSSSAGKRLGKADKRHLWPEMLRVITEVSPRYVVGENVRGLTSWNRGMVFDEVCTDLENLGYSVAPFVIPASSKNAPHQRERVWLVAYSDSVRLNQCDSEHEKYTGKTGFHAFDDVNAIIDHWKRFPTEPPVCGPNDGLPTELDGITFPKWRTESIKAYGNAIVPQVVYEIFKSIQQYETTNV
jgi:DNA (cytosine-5)-methyltransferase 1